MLITALGPLPFTPCGCDPLDVQKQLPMPELNEGRSKKKPIVAGAPHSRVPRLRRTDLLVDAPSTGGRLRMLERRSQKDAWLLAVVLAPELRRERTDVFTAHEEPVGRSLAAGCRGGLYVEIV